MTTIERLTDLTAATSPEQDWHQNGWETSSACVDDVVVFTYNGSGASYSDDYGQTFHPIAANELCRRHGEDLWGDQVVIYNPHIRKFVWVLMIYPSADLVAAVASPDDIKSSGGTAWVSWRIPHGNFEDGISSFDRPTVSFTDRFTYIAVNLGLISIAVQLHNSELAEATALHLGYIVAPDVFWLRAAQNNLGGTARFAALMNVRARENGRDYVSNVRVFEWPDVANAVTWFDVPIAAVPNEGSTVLIPSGEWIKDPRGSVQILGITVRGSELWTAWYGLRTVPDPPRPTHTFPQPHIGIAVIDLTTRTLKQQLYMWNPDCAFVFPDLATNGNQNVGFSFCWGGPTYPPGFGIGELTWPTTWPISSHWSVTPTPSLGAGGDYVTVRRSYPEDGSFCAAGFNTVAPAEAAVNHPYYVVFSPS